MHFVSADDSPNPFKELGIKESDILTLSDGRYDEFHGYNDYERVGSAIIDMRTNKIARFINRDSVIGEGMKELDMTTRFLTADPMAEKYYQLSPYGYCANNPILFIDPNGEEIWIYYGDNNKVRYDNGKLYNTDGTAYKGNDNFVTTSVGYLNKMNSIEIGNTVIGNLVSSTNTFNFKNQFSVDKNTGAQITDQLSFTPTGNGGGDIKAGALMGNVANSDQKLSSTAHELFHGYQRENGENSDGINKEIGAYTFGESVRMQYELQSTDNISNFPLGNSTSNGIIYNNAMQDLIQAKSFNQTLYNIAGNNFKSGAIANSKKIYDMKVFNPNYHNPLISRFYPLIRFPK